MDGLGWDVVEISVQAPFCLVSTALGVAHENVSKTHSKSFTFQHRGLSERVDRFKLYTGSISTKRAPLEL